MNHFNKTPTLSWKLVTAILLCGFLLFLATVRIFTHNPAKKVTVIIAEGVRATTIEWTDRQGVKWKHIEIKSNENKEYY